jgi:hypothetical protein
MDTTLSQEDISVFCTSPTSPKERPGDADYAAGVEVRYTAPAKWWNWFWNIITSWFTHHKTDNESMLAEQENLLSAADITPAAGDTHQVAKSFITVAENNSETYDTETTTEGGVVRDVNRPYVIGDTIFLPNTELL